MPNAYRPPGAQGERKPKKSRGGQLTLAGSMAALVAMLFIFGGVYMIVSVSLITGAVLFVLGLLFGGMAHMARYK